MVLCQALGVLAVGYSPVLSGARCTSFTRNPEQSQMSRGAAVPLSPENTQRGSFLPWEIATNLQGPPFSEVLLSSTHSFIPFLVKYCAYRDLLCAECYLIYNIAITKRGIVLASLTVGAEKAVDYNGGERVLESDHPLGLPHSQQRWVSS